MHTLKGAARSVSLTEIETLCQEAESLLSHLTREGAVPTRAALERLHDAIDGVTRLLSVGTMVDPSQVRSLERASGAPSKETTAAPVLPPVDSVRVSPAALDALLFHAEDLLIPRLAGEERVQDAEALLGALERCRPAARGDGGPWEAVRAAQGRARDLLVHLVRDQRATEVAVDQVLDEIRRIRMTPASSVLGLFGAMVRNLAHGQGKDVEWVERGTELHVDRKVLEGMKDPLIHLVRNAIDHGIEPPEVRRKAGKPPRGRVAVTIASREGGRIEIRVEDDGGGIDLEGIGAAAVRSRIMTAEEVGALREDAVLDLIFRSGLSTNPIITNVSGHGLGMAIVRERVERLGGQIRVETRAGAGTTVIMEIPATIATFRGLLVRAGKQLFLLPAEAIERARRLDQGASRCLDGRETVLLDGQAVPVGRLGVLLGTQGRDAGTATDGGGPCIVVRSGDERAAFLVDEILGGRDVLVKEFGPPLARVRNAAGAGLLGTGQLVLILRPSDLVKSLQALAPGASVPAAEERTSPPVVLVVDDSITTRTMEKNLLEAAGYQVRFAADGVEAWTALKSQDIDVVLSDVDMPRMNGFDLTSRIRADETLADLPVVLVSALETREDKERGIEVGANAYVVKSGFDQTKLLEILRRLA